jgi:hypothetical protein
MVRKTYKRKSRLTKKKLVKRQRKKRTLKAGGLFGKSGLKWYKKCYINWQCKKGECCLYTGIRPLTYGIGFSRHSCQPCSSRKKRI